MRIPRATASATLTVLAVLALAANGLARADEGDPPSRVARLSYVEGAVSFQPAGLPDWTAAERNRPLTSGDRLWTDQESVAELDLGDAVLRLGAMTGFAFLNLDDRFAQIQLSAGILIVRVWDTSSGQSYEIDTPQLAVQLTQPGAYRVEVDEPGNTTLVKVSEGEAMALSSDARLAIDAQQVMVFTGSASGTSLSYNAASLGPPDDLDTWSATRDRQQQESPSRQYVADDTPGTYELDDNGRWQSTPEYGYVWTPAVVVAAWVPFRFGHWVWIAPWGWTWIDDAPWGYATFHYGRWVFLRGSWCWVPGPRPLRPVYAPALVAWAHGPGFSGPGAAAPNVGWFPLGPHEVYAPAGRVSEGYLRNVNTANTTITSASYITDVYQNRVTNIRYVNSSAAAISAVPQNVFSSGQRVTGHTLPVTTSTLAGMSVAAAAPPVTPQRQSVLGAGTGPKVMHPPPSLANRGVIAHAAPPRAPASFETQVAAIQANGGRPLAAPDLARLQPGTPTARVRVLAAPKGSRLPLPQSPTPQSTQAPAQPSLGERARALESPSLPPATTTRTFVPAPSATVPSAIAPTLAAPRPPAHTDRPPGASQGTFSSYEAPHIEDKPSSEPGYRPEKPAPRVETSPAPVVRTTRPPSSPPPRSPTQQNPVQPSHPRQEHPSSPPKNAEHSRDESPKAERSRDRVDR
jgi:FecR protein